MRGPGQGPCQGAGVFTPACPLSPVLFAHRPVSPARGRQGDLHEQANPPLRPVNAAARAGDDFIRQPLPAA